ncbi:MAG: VOC family protein [Pseudomonas sp.]|uniref:VOC family protein n=1 Tax=Pseudomonas sp. TaxID=306 RepID=UPI003D0D4B66
MQLLLNLDVPDLQAAVAFYRQALDLRVGRYLFEGSVVEMLGAPVPIYLLHKAAGSPPCPGVPSPRDYERHWMPLHLDFSMLHWPARWQQVRVRKAKSVSSNGGAW